MADRILVVKSATDLATPRLKFDTVPFKTMVRGTQPVHVVHRVEISVGRDDDDTARVERVEDQMLECKEAVGAGHGLENVGQDHSVRCTLQGGDEKLPGLLLTLGL